MTLIICVIIAIVIAVVALALSIHNYREIRNLRNDLFLNQTKVQRTIIIK